MQTTMPVPQPSSKAEQAEAAFVQMLADASQRGFYGTAGMTLSVQDGRIQHIRLATERMIK